ncbi:hypothetical protein NBRC116583_07010 [Arenicella sp. 4NH20-0111]|uniref:hypothetical protein n=1 Tax=Arenicella sp. 4NH20-0111 TaxID=3127648 RepID=UPI0031049FF7
MFNNTKASIPEIQKNTALCILMTNQVLEIVRSGNTLRDLPSIVEKLSVFNESELFDTLFPNSIRRQSPGKGVAFSAYALNELNPKATISLEEAIDSLLLEWDISIEEVVFYLSKQFGKENIELKAKEIKGSLTGEEIVRLETIEYWLGINT